ncbi:hypothetical protein CLOSTMETH_03922 [[Clostridium] methylpentosum DSM 5476]|uniref:Uncharacterized protein n=1 Tax=[Clostridium] methylpentosum DSM 5476 TaxID=537013 RepID=C0EJ71_9FIRM|nr:hypothetical protein CLOSTMETH_03922 [[Clostridium] methylpentosum DSM 5476]
MPLHPSRSTLKACTKNRFTSFLAAYKMIFITVGITIQRV